MTGTDPRHLAHAVLQRVETGAFCDLLVGETLTRSRLPERDAALFTALVYGTVTWQGRLDWTLAGHARRPIDRLDPATRIALRLGIFQLTRLDRVPAHAAVDTSVDLAKRGGGPGAARFVNAVLRAVARAGERPIPDDADPAWALAVRWSHPEWLVRRWIAELGAERVPALLAANNQPAPTVFRVDLRARSRSAALEDLAAAGVPARACTWARTAIAIDGPAGEAAARPWLAPQGEASQLVAELVGVRPGERVLDACAAPGGKTGGLAEDLGIGGPGRIVAADRSRPGMRRALALAGGDPPRRISALVADATLPPFARNSFDAVLLDVPCSGLGTLRSHPEIRWRRTPTDPARLASVQATILRAAAPGVRPGGRLVYSTCTLVAEENESVVCEFLGDTPGWTRDDAQ